ncbi:MAG: SLBB domain-containing protein [Deltaproteobacteria bacterium]|nr:SLBB domain-containing protein [Deltaproteobacteria bacterium]MCB9788882.1 SLBB domain-containing protein [Deltaproteobacteria bacterium]
MPAPLNIVRALVATLALATALPAVAAPDSTRPVQPGDELMVVIPQVTPSRRKVEVDFRGEIGLDLFGNVKVAGLALDEARDAVRTALARYLNSTAGVSLIMVSEGRLVLVTGAVSKPGVVRLAEDGTLWQAIQLAGGPAPGAALHRVQIGRHGSEMRVDLSTFLGGDLSAPMPALEAGDVVLVPADAAYGQGQTSPWAVYLGHQALAEKVVVMGAVRSPGIYERGPGVTALTALALAGGATAEADLSSVRVLTVEGSRVVDLVSELGRATSVRPLPAEMGAIIYVPAGVVGRHDPLAKHVNVIGAVRSPGRHPIAGTLSLIDALSLAGGPTEDASVGRVRVLHTAPRWSLATSYDVSGALAEGGLVTQVLIHPGDTVALGERRKGWRTFVQVLSDLAIISTSVVLLVGTTN